jgi:hypothetical protein
MFARYVKLIPKLGGHAIMSVPGSLVALFSTLTQNNVRVVETGAAPSNVDLQCPVMSLPRAFRTTLRTIPAEIPYLRAPESKIEYWGRRLGKAARMRVGLRWAGKRDLPIESSPIRRRSMVLKNLQALTELPVEFHSLQNETFEDDATTLSATMQIIDHHQCLRDFADTAALIHHMDLVVSIDTSVAHLAGALGKPLWMMLPQITDYRWMIEGDNSPWYPNAKLFRQKQAGNWDMVVEDVKSELRKVVCGGRIS